MKTYCFDIDGVLTSNLPEGDYSNRKPYMNVIEAVNNLYDAGHTIKIFTARGSLSGIDWREFTERQLESWGLKYHELIMGKPHADVFIDDRAMDLQTFVERSLNA